DLSGANLSRANLSRADLSWADLSGADLYGADLSGANLSRVNLSRANLYGADLSGANLSRADLSRADLSGANLSRANLSRANLSGADLYGADLYETVKRLASVPSLHRRMLAAIEAGGVLDMDSWHGESCETTHYRSGWAIHLAGPAGQMLEACMGPATAGALIHLVSCPQLEGKVPDFHCSNDDAMADIRRLAALEPELEAATT
ncbi:MAG: pentapeptide repeat-containing protein, partial [Acidobacteria bacterium]|nr:pentapeptide repeat-containing protein [Acidobacteriota bacterium]